MYSCLSFRVLPYSLSLYPFSFSLFFVVKLIIPFTCREIFSFFSFFYPIMLGRLLHVVLHSIPILPHHIFHLFGFLLFSVCLVFSHTYITYIHTYPHVSLLHSWMGETKYACFIIFFLFFCSLFCFVSCSYCLSKVFESALINIVS